MALTPRNIWTPDGGDTVDLLADMSATAVSVDNAIDAAVTEASQSPVRTFTTVALLNGWTAPDGTFAYVTADGVYYVRANSAWRVLQVVEDTGWHTVALEAGFTGSCKYRTKNGVTELRFDISGTITSDVALTTALPFSATPSTEATSIAEIPAFIDPPTARSVGVVYFGASSRGLRATASGGTAVTRVRGSATWLVQ